MKAKNLRIGNLVDLYGTIATIQRADFNERPPKGIAVDAGKPIPLTKEWALRLGFNKWQDRYCLEAWSPGHPSQRFDIDWKDGNIMMKSRYQGEDDNLLMRHIKHVHELQNLYFALTGKELEVS